MIENIFDLDYWKEFINTYAFLKPLVGIGLPFVEALIPVLPLMALVTFNILLLGVMWGFIFSYIGSVLGAFVVFSTCKYLMRNKDVKKFKRLTFLNEQRLLPLVIIYSFPFTPSSLINVSCGVLKYDTKKFLIGLLWGKFVMFILLTFVGSGIEDFIRYRNIKSLVITVVLLALSYILGKIVEKRYHL